MSHTSSQLPPEDPAFRAWRRYRSTEDYWNTRRWAVEGPNVDGSLWSAFYAGFTAGVAATRAPAAEEGP